MRKHAAKRELIDTGTDKLRASGRARALQRVGRRRQITLARSTEARLDEGAEGARGPRRSVALPRWTSTPTRLASSVVFRRAQRRAA
jgi:hypothetical protein